MKNRILLFALSFLSFQISAQCTWTGGGGNNNWSNAGNWSCGHVPVAADNVVINILNTTVTLDIADVQITNLTINNGATLTGNNNISLSGTLTLAGATLSGSGTMTVAGAATVGYLNLTTRHLILNGGGSFGGGGFTGELNNSAALTFAAGQTVSMIDNFSFSTGDGSNCIITNNGILDIGNSFGGAIGGHFINTGTINLSMGSFTVVNSIHTGATINIAENAQFSIAGAASVAPHSFTDCTILGIGRMYVSGGNFTFPNVNFQSGNTISAKLYLEDQTITNINANITCSDVHLEYATLSGVGMMTIPVNGKFLTNYIRATINCPFTNQGTYIGNVPTYFNNIFINTGTITGYGIDLTNATVTNTGIVSPGVLGSGSTAGIMDMTPFDNSAATLAIELAANTFTGAGFIGNDQLRVQSAVTLGGTLNISYINSFTPVINDVFTIMTCSGGCSGNFSNIVSPISPTQMWEVDVTTNPNEVRIKLVLIPPTVCTWNGTNVSGNWSDGTKWSCGHAPTTGNNVVINSGTVTLDVIPDVQNDLTLSGGTLTGNRNIALTGALTWSGGTISGTGTMTVAMATTITNAPTLDTRSLTLNGGGTIAGGFNTSNGANLTIPLSKTLTVTNSSELAWGGNGGVLTIVGTLVKAGTGTLNCNFQNFQNTGTVNINAGILRMGYGGTHNGATFNTTTVSGFNTFCTFSGGTHTFNGSSILGTGGFFANNSIISTFTNNTVASTLSNFSIGGTSTFTLGQNLDLNFFTYFSTNTLTGTGNITTNGANIANGTLGFTGNLIIGSLNWTGGTMGSTVHTTLPPGSVGTTNNTVTTTGRFTINGTFTVQSGIFNCNLFDNNDGDMTIQSGGTVNSNDEFGNFGRLILASGSIFNANADFYNANSLRIQGGAFTANTAFINSDALIIESGILNAVGAFSNYLGTVEIQTGTLNASSTFDVTQGTIKGNGTLNLNSTLINTDDATIAPGLSPGTLTINPSVSSTTAAIYEMEIMGNQADKLESTGNIALDGTLKLILDNPEVGSYTIFNSTGGSVSGFGDLDVLYSTDGGATFSPTTPPNTTIQINTNNILVNINGSVLPVELLDFKATPQPPKGELVMLTWQTANEVNNKGFQVERIPQPPQGAFMAWEILGFVAPQPLKGAFRNYEFLDKSPLWGWGAYRLRQIDNDGKETLSKVISVARKGTNKLKVNPNPVSNMLLIETDFDLVRNETNTFQIFNLLGQQVRSGKKPPSGVWGLDVSALPQGTYFLKVGVEQVKFIKQ